MPIGYIIPSQDRPIKPFSSKLYSGDLSYTKSFVHNYFNGFTRIFGQNLIAKGLETSILSFTNTDITVRVSPGYLIQDETFIEIISTTDVTYPNASFFDSSGSFIVFARFKSRQTMDKNDLMLGITYVSPNGIPLDPLDPTKDLVILASLTFSKDESGNINSVISNIDGNITIQGQSRSIRPIAEPQIISLLDGGDISFV